jgi:5-methylcytosine-specific restriction protein A
MNRNAFRTEMSAQINRAEKQGRPHIEVNAGELHRTVGGYPAEAGASHALPVCCHVMHAEYARGAAEIVHSPPSGAGAALTIRYRLPRPTHAVESNGHDRSSDVTAEKRRPEKVSFALPQNTVETHCLLADGVSANG